MEELIPFLYNGQGRATPEPSEVAFYFDSARRVFEGKCDFHEGLEQVTLHCALADARDALSGE